MKVHQGCLYSTSLWHRAVTLKAECEVGGKHRVQTEADVAKINAETPALTEKGTHRGLTAQGMEMYGPLIAAAVVSLNTGRVFAAQRCTRCWSKWQRWETPRAHPSTLPQRC